MKSVLRFELEGELVTLTRYDDFGNVIGIEEAMYPDICMEEELICCIVEIFDTVVKGYNSDVVKLTTVYDDKYINVEVCVKDSTITFDNYYDEYQLADIMDTIIESNMTVDNFHFLRGEMIWLIEKHMTVYIRP